MNTEYKQKLLKVNFSHRFVSLSRLAIFGSLPRKYFPGFPAKFLRIFPSSFHVCRQCLPLQIKYVSFAVKKWRDTGFLRKCENVVAFSNVHFDILRYFFKFCAAAKPFWRLAFYDSVTKIPRVLTFEDT